MAELKFVTLEAGLLSSFGYLEKMSSVKCMSFHKEKTFELAQANTGVQLEYQGAPRESRLWEIVAREDMKEEGAQSYLELLRGSCP